MAVTDSITDNLAIPIILVVKYSGGAKIDIRTMHLLLMFRGNFSYEVR